MARYLTVAEINFIDRFARYLREEAAKQNIELQVDALAKGIASAPQTSIEHGIPNDATAREAARQFVSRLINESEDAKLLRQIVLSKAQPGIPNF